MEEYIIGEWGKKSIRYPHKTFPADIKTEAFYIASILKYFVQTR